MNNNLIADLRELQDSPDLTKSTHLIRVIPLIRDPDFFTSILAVISPIFDC